MLLQIEVHKKRDGGAIAPTSEDEQEQEPEPLTFDELEFRACARMGYSLVQYQCMTWHEYYYASQHYRHRRDLALENSRLVAAWVVSHSMGVKKAVQPIDITGPLPTIDQPQKVIEKPDAATQQVLIQEGAWLWEQIQQHKAAKKNKNKASLN